MLVLPPIILASKSPRRQELLQRLGLNFKVELKEVDESYPLDLAIPDIAPYIAQKKLQPFQNRAEIILTADTIVAVDAQILGKPKDHADAVRMLSLISGRAHEVYTGVSLLYKNQIHTFYDCTRVYCRLTTIEEIEYYIQHFKPFDKAGSYGVQDWWGNAVVTRMEGSYTNVMGLPTEKLYTELQQLFPKD